MNVKNIIKNGDFKNTANWSETPNPVQLKTPGSISFDNSKIVCVDITAVSDIIAKAEAQGFKVKLKRNKIVMKIPKGYFEKCSIGKETSK